MTLTFLDAGVLIAAARGTSACFERAYEILDDPNRTFASSRFVMLEVLPKARFHGRAEEVRIYESHFDRVAQWAEPVDDVVRLGQQRAEEHGLSAMDALHVAGAELIGADELITVEKPTKPIHRAATVRVTTLYPSEED